MLRRAQKRANEAVDSHEKTQIKRITKSLPVLGAKRAKDEETRILENLVIGSDREILDSLDAAHKDSRTKPRKPIDEIPKPAWEDDDDDTINVKVSDKDHRHIYFKHKKGTDVTGKSYKETLKSQFEKVSGAPRWAKLKWEKSDSEGDDSDTEGNQLLRTTGDYTTGSESLPKGVLDIKRVSDANKDDPLKGKVKAVEFHPSAQVMLAAGFSQTLTLFQVDGKTNPKIQSVFLDKFPIYTAHFTRDGREVIMGSRHKSFYYYDMIGGKVVSVPNFIGCEDNNTKSFVMSPDGRHMVFLGAYGRLNLVTTTSKEYIHTMKMNGSVDAVTFSPDGDTMYSHGDDGEVYVWDMRTRDCVHRFVDDGCVKGKALAASRNGQYLATGSDSGVVNIYDANECRVTRCPTPVKAVMNLTSPCTSMAFNPTTEILAIASDYAESAVKLVHFPSLTVFSNYPEKTDHIRIPLCMDFSARSGYLTIGNNKGEALLYRLKHYGNY